MRELLADLFDRSQQMGMGSCGIRFFEPTQQFWRLVEVFPEGTKFLELGAGRGDTTKEARERGLVWSGYDLHVDADNLANGVMPCNALRIPVLAGAVYLFPRPDHSGWAEPAMQRVLEQGGTAIYLGLERNVLRDIPDLLELPHERQPGMGLENECAWIFSPSAEQGN